MSYCPQIVSNTYTHWVINDAVKEYGEQVQDDVGIEHCSSDEKRWTGSYSLCKCCSSEDATFFACVALFAIGFFMGLYQTLKSLALAVKYERRAQKYIVSYTKVKTQDDQEPSLRVYEPISLNSLPSAPSLPEIQEGQTIMNVVTVLVEMRNDRLCRALSQGTMTLGAGILTAILIVYCVVAPKFYMLGIVGAGLMVTGVGGVMYFVNKGLRPSDEFHEALSELALLQ